MKVNSKKSSSNFGVIEDKSKSSTIDDAQIISFIQNNIRKNGKNYTESDYLNIAQNNYGAIIEYAQQLKAQYEDSGKYTDSFFLEYAQRAIYIKGISSYNIYHQDTKRFSDPEWNEYSYEEIIQMANNGCNVPKDVLAWAKEQQESDITDYLIVSDDTNDQTENNNESDISTIRNNTKTNILQADNANKKLDLKFSKLKDLSQKVLSIKNRQNTDNIEEIKKDNAEMEEFLSSIDDITIDINQVVNKIQDLNESTLEFSQLGYGGSGNKKSYDTKNLTKSTGFLDLLSGTTDEKLVDIASQISQELESGVNNIQMELESNETQVLTEFAKKSLSEFSKNNKENLNEENTETLAKNLESKVISNNILNSNQNNKEVEQDNNENNTEINEKTPQNYETDIISPKTTENELKNEPNNIELSDQVEQENNSILNLYNTENSQDKTETDSLGKIVNQKNFPKSKLENQVLLKKVLTALKLTNSSIETNKKSENEFEKQLEEFYEKSQNKSLESSNIKTSGLIKKGFETLNTSIAFSSRLFMNLKQLIKGENKTAIKTIDSIINNEKVLHSSDETDIKNEENENLDKEMNTDFKDFDISYKDSNKKITRNDNNTFENNNNNLETINSQLLSIPNEEEIKDNESDNTNTQNSDNSNNKTNQIDNNLNEENKNINNEFLEPEEPQNSNETQILNDDNNENLISASASTNLKVNENIKTDEMKDKKLTRFNNDSIIESRKKRKKVQAVSPSSGGNVSK